MGRDQQAGGAVILVLIGGFADHNGLADGVGRQTGGRMLRELHIQNLAVIEDAAIELVEGLNCFTGQTGAGKSLVLGAFEILLGLRTGGLGEWVRKPADEARLAGLFEISDERIRRQIEEVLDQKLEDGVLLITRKVFATGRSSLTVNGLPQVTQTVRQVGELLVDIHGRHDHQFLLRPGNQTLMLDDFGGCEGLRIEYAGLVRSRSELIRKREQLTQSSRFRGRQMAMLQEQIDELELLNPQPGEFESLRALERRMASVERLRQKVGEAHQALYESEGSVVERLGLISQLLGELAELDERLRDAADALRGSTLGLREVAFDLERYVSGLEVDPAAQQENEHRLNHYHRLLSRFVGIPGPGQDPGELLLDYLESIRREYEQLTGEAGDAGVIDRQIEELAARLKEVGERLQSARMDAAARLEPLVNHELSELGMAEAVFTVLFEAWDESGEGASLGPKRVEFLIRPNPGQPAAPLRRIASAGELSRIMLALKSILSETEHISVLVFDEIDANIGGRLGTVIGTKLKGLSHGVSGASSGGGRQGSSTGRSGQVGRQGGRQILCITHLPQIAAFADRQLRIVKSLEGEGSGRTTRSRVEVVEGEARVVELAEMLAGREASETTLKQARELLRRGGGALEAAGDQAAAKGKAAAEKQAPGKGKPTPIKKAAKRSKAVSKAGRAGGGSGEAGKKGGGGEGVRPRAKG